MYFLAAFVLLLVVELMYFRIAKQYNIVDRPNERSSHKELTLRGGGIIFSVAVLLWGAISGESLAFVVGMTSISIVSFWDDVKSLPNSIRLLIHFLSVSLLIYQLNITLPIWGYPVLLILIIGTLNAYNFMDGINGITGAYSLITLLTLYYINEKIVPYTSRELLIWLILSVLVFNFFNFRKRAKCFAGDIGSLSMAFALCFLISLLVKMTGEFRYILLMLIYGLDTVTTIIFRLLRKENIFEAHRSHLYQFLANEKRLPHLLVAGIYAAVQAFINIIILSKSRVPFPTFLLILIISGISFVLLRLAVEGRNRLLIAKEN